MEFIFGRAGAALLSPCHGKMCAAGSAIFLSRRLCRRGQCDFRVTAKCTLWAGRKHTAADSAIFPVTASLPPRAVRFSCHGKMYAAGSAIFLSRQDVRRRQCDFRVTASLPPRAGRKQTAAPSGYAGFRRLSASIQNACPRKARASGILNRFAAPTIPHAVLTTTKTAPKAIKLW